MPDFVTQFELLERLADLKYDGKFDDYQALLQGEAGTITDAIRVIPSFDSTALIAMAVHRDHHFNPLTKIPCLGSPIGGYVYDNVADAYFVHCAAFVPLGYVPVAFQLSMPGNPDWMPHVPMPESLLRRYMDQIQLSSLDDFKATYPPPYNIEYLQMIV